MTPAGEPGAGCGPRAGRLPVKDTSLLRTHQVAVHTTVPGPGSSSPLLAASMLTSDRGLLLAGSVAVGPSPSFGPVRTWQRPDVPRARGHGARPPARLGGEGTVRQRLYCGELTEGGLKSRAQGLGCPGAAMGHRQGSCGDSRERAPPRGGAMLREASGPCHEPGHLLGRPSCPRGAPRRPSHPPGTAGLWRWPELREVPRTGQQLGCPPPSVTAGMTVGRVARVGSQSRLLGQAWPCRQLPVGVLLSGPQGSLGSRAHHRLALSHPQEGSWLPPSSGPWHWAPTQEC